MVGRWAYPLSRRLVSVVAVASLLTAALLLGLISPHGVAGETATVGWIRQFGTSGNDAVRGVSAVAGSIYVGEFRGDPYPDQSYVHKYDAAGGHVWTTEVSDTRVNGLYDEGLDAMYACSTGVYVAMTGLYGGPDGDGGAAGLLKYSAGGIQQWVSGIAIDNVNMPAALFADSGGTYATGTVFGPPAGERGFVRKYDASGATVWTKVYDVDPGYYPSSVSVYSGTVYVGGVVSGTGESFVRKYDSAGTELWTRLPGFAPPVVVHGVSADPGGVYVAGSAHDPSEAGGRQAFVRKYDSSGNNIWTREFGSSEDDVAHAVFVDSSGVYVAGYTDGLLPGQTNKGGADAFVRKYDGSGNEVWTYQFGSSADDTATCISADATGIYAAGDTDGAMPGLTSSGGQDIFLVRIATNDPPAQPSNLLPANAATGVSLTPSLQSSTLSDPDAGDTHEASQWQITATPGDYSGYIFSSGTDTSNLTTINVPPGTLANSMTYYWHVRHQDNHDAWSSWSAETSFTTVAPPNQPPGQPNNVSPANAATAVSLLPTLQSSAFTDPDAGDTHAASQWQIRASGGDYSSPVFESDADTANLTSITIPSGTLSYLTTYYWRAMHQDNHGAWSAWSLETSFTTAATANQAPGQPANTAPDSGATGVSLTPALSSSAFSDPDAGDTHAASQWQITTSAGDYSSPVFDSAADTANLTGISVPLGTLTYSTTYHWRVRHQDNHGDWSAYSAESSFSTLALVSQSPDQPTASSPAAGAADVSLTPTLSASGFSDPDAGDTHGASQWQLRTTSGTYAAPAYDSGSSASHLTSVVIPSGMLDYATTYLWHVRYMDNNGDWSDWSEELRFTTLGPDDGDGGNGEVGGCCSSSSVEASPGDVAIAWGTLGLCFGTGLLFARRLGKRRRK